MKRIIVTDKFDEHYQSNVTKFISAVRPLGLDFSNIVTIQDLAQNRDVLMNLGPEDSVMLVGSGPFKFLREMYHFGVRSENYADCSELYRLSIEGGAFVKCVLDYPGDDVMKDWISPEFCRQVDTGNFSQAVITDYREAVDFMMTVNDLPKDMDFGFDFESNGPDPLAKDFILSGYSIAKEDSSVFISLTDIYEQTQDLTELYDELRKWIMERQEHIWTYNMAFEYKACHRVLGIDPYNLSDASVLNIIEGNHLKKFSLKWSAQKYLGVNTWDVEFDKITDIIDSMLFIMDDSKKKSDRKKILKVTPNDFEQTEEWKMLCDRYPNHVGRFKELLLRYWGNAFMCIPSDILGYYCNLDAYYTLKIYLSHKDKYSPECWSTFMDNTRLAVRLSNGLYIDEDYRKKYSDYCQSQMVWGITYCATYKCYEKMKEYKKGSASTKHYTPQAQYLIKNSKFFGGNPVEIVKNILLDHLDSSTGSRFGINEGKLAMTFGHTFAEAFIGRVEERIKEIKFKGQIDEGIGRKKKILGLLAEDIVPLLGLDKITFGPKHDRLEKYMYYLSSYEELRKAKIGSSIDDVKEVIFAFGRKWSRLEYADWVSETYFKCKSPLENDKIVWEMTMKYRHFTSILAGLFESTQQLPEADKFYSSRGISDIGQAFSEVMDQWKAYFNGEELTVPYPEKVFIKALEHYKSPKKELDKEVFKKKGEKKYIYSTSDVVKDMWADFNGWIAQSQFFPQVNNQYEDYSTRFEPTDLDDMFFFHRKFVLMYLLFKKHSKVESTYVGESGMLKKTSKKVIEDERHIPIRYAEEGEPGAVDKLFIRYQVNEKSSKRWSSPFHTIISHSDLKNAITVPPSYSDNGEIIYGGGDFLMTYFDISSAEVKSAGYASKDPGLIECFDKDIDVYIKSSKLYLGEEGFEKLSGKEKKMWRKRFKTIFLGVLYGLGKSSLADRLNCSIDEADMIIQGLYNSYPKLREYVEAQQNFPLENNGYINSFYGDKLRIKEFEYLLKATSDSEIKSLVARIKRLGVNLVIQGGTSTVMQSGFFNDVRVSIKDGWRVPLQVVITVHDSNTGLLPTENIFDIQEFYNINFTDFAAQSGPKVKLLFELLVGTAYESAIKMAQLDKDTIEFEGSADSLLKIYNKIMYCPYVTAECSHSKEELVPKYVDHPMKRFIMEQGTSMIKDVSSYKVTFRRV